MNEFPILWKDQDLLVIDKPSGLLSLPDGYDPSLPHVKSLLEPTYGQLWMVHRLDRETSGVMIVARNAGAHQKMNKQFQSRQVKKVYEAIVLGCPQWDRKIVQLPLRTNAGRRHITVVDRENGKPSVTQLRVLERFTNYCFIEAKPITGRRHQIRAHLTFEGHPIAGDNLYGFHEIGSDDLFQGQVFAREPVFERTALHARSIEFRHPGDGQVYLVEAPLAIDLQRALYQLRM